MSQNKHVNITRRFQRSVRIDADLCTSGALDGYVPVESTLNALRRLVEQYANSSQRAFTWTGPYGGGKSSLALLLATLLSPRNPNTTSLSRILSKPDQVFFKKHLPTSKDGWLVIPIVGGDQTPKEIFISAIHKAIRNRWPHRIPGSVSKALKNIDADPIQTIEQLSIELGKKNDGVLIVLDEMGKVLEHSARNSGDLIFFQDLAERISRAGSPILFIGVLHQAFEVYARDLGRQAQDEWAKVQGRFVDIALSTGLDEFIDLIGRAINGPKPSSAFLKASKFVVKSVAKRRKDDGASLQKYLTKCYPLHPAVALLLGPISRSRFGQNERSTFGFLSSGEPSAFQNYLNQEYKPGGSLYSLWHLWDYLTLNLSSSILSSTEGHKWSTNTYAVARAEANGDELHAQLTKAIALVHMFGQPLNIHADIDLLQSCFPGKTKKALREALTALEKWSIVRFKDHLTAWTIFEGSDFDISAALQNAAEKIGDFGPSLVRSLGAVSPIVAKRHYHKSGTLRWFDTVILPSSTSLKTSVTSQCLSNGATGAFFLLIPSDESDAKRMSSTCARASKYETSYPFAVGFNQTGYRIKSEAIELAALEYIQKHEKVLEGDPVARKEVRSRIRLARQNLEELVLNSIASATWYTNGKGVKNTGAAAISHLASNLADQFYSEAPIVKNELINRVKPSSAAVSARRELLYNMVNKSSDENLGMTRGFPPQRALYASLLQATGIHHRNKDGSYSFGKPRDTEISHTYDALWLKLEEIIRKSQESPSNATKVYRSFSQPPFGLREGVIPIFVLAGLLAMENNLVLYVDGMFHPSIDERVVDRLLQSPDSISFRHFEMTGVAKQTLSKLKNVVVDPENKEMHESALAITKQLVSFVHFLPKWTQNTRLVSPHAIAVRSVLLDPSDPDKMLFEDLPNACGVDLKIVRDPKRKQSNRSDQLTDEYVSQLTSALTELRTAYVSKLEDIHQLLLKSLKVGADNDSITSILKTRAKAIHGITGDLRLDGFATHLSEYSQTTEWLEGMAGFAAKKPCRSWIDADLNIATLEISDLCTRLQRAEAYLETMGRPAGAEALTLVIGTGASTKALIKTVAIPASSRHEIDQISKTLKDALSNSEVDDEILLAAIAKFGEEIISRLSTDDEEGNISSVPTQLEEMTKGSKQWRH